METHEMNTQTISTLYVLYDPACGVCCRARDWMLKQTKFIELKLVPATSQTAKAMFPALYENAAAARQQLEELTVIDDHGGVYRGGEAWVMCLYALAGYRSLALRLSDPDLLPWARNAFSLLNHSRRTLSELLGLNGNEELAQIIQSEVEPVCVQSGQPFMVSSTLHDDPPGQSLRVAHTSWLW